MYNSVEDGEHILEVTLRENGVEGLALSAVALSYGAHQARAQEESVCPAYEVSVRFIEHNCAWARTRQ